MLGHIRSQRTAKLQIFMCWSLFAPTQSLPPPSIPHAVKLSSKDKIVSLNHFQLGPQEGINTKAIVQTPKHMDITTYSQKHLTCFTFHGLLYLSLTANIFKNVFLKSSKLMRFCKCFLIQNYTYSLRVSKKKRS